MTALTYMVGNFELKTYAEAKELSQKFNLPILTKYTEIKEKFPVDPFRYHNLATKKGN